MISLTEYLIVAAILFSLSVIGIFLNRKNLILLLMCIELMLLAVNINFVAFSAYLGDITGQVFVFFILTVAAAEAAIGLAILVVLFRNRRTINVLANIPIVLLLTKAVYFQIKHMLPSEYRHLVLNQLRNMGGTRFFVSLNNHQIDEIGRAHV